MTTRPRSDDYSPRTLLLFAAAVVFVATWLPFGEVLIYPFRLFGTFIHEAAHALAAVVTGGQVVGMHVNWDTSGLTLTRGGSRILTSSAGYLGTALVGATLLVVARHRHWVRPALVGLGAATLLATFAFAGYGGALIPLVGLGAGLALLGYGRRLKQTGQPSTAYYLGGAGALGATVVFLAISGGLLTWAIGLLIGAAILAAGLLASPRLAHAALLFLGVTTSLDGLRSLKTLFDISMLGHGHSDAANMAQHTGIPATLWAVLWGLTGVVMVAVALWFFWRDERRENFATAFENKGRM